MTKIWWLARAAVATVCLGLAVAACGDSGTTGDEQTTGADTGTATATASATTEATADAPAGATITIADMSFGDPITVAPGTEVTIVNNDSAEHSVTAQSAGQFDVHVDGGEQGTLTAPAEPGEYQFYCTYHPSMKGTLIVK